MTSSMFPREHPADWNPQLCICEECGDWLQSSYPGEFVACDCGASFVDQTQHYSRYGGSVMPYEPDAEELLALYKEAWDAIPDSYLGLNAHAAIVAGDRIQQEAEDEEDN